MRMNKYAPFLLALLVHGLIFALFSLPEKKELSASQPHARPSGIDLSGFSTHSKKSPASPSSPPGPRPQNSAASTTSVSTGDSRTEGLSAPNTMSAEGADSIIVSAVGPSYPTLAREKGLEGVVKLRAHYKEGSITQVEILESSGAKTLDESAKKALLSWKTKNGMEGTFEKTFQFKLKD